MPESRSFFRSVADKFDPWAGREEEKGLRDCQLGAVKNSSLLHQRDQVTNLGATAPEP